MPSYRDSRSHGSPPDISVAVATVEWNLPLFEDLFLNMQGQNVMLVDFYLQDLEAGLLREYVETEKTPFPATLIVSALNQMWIFALYELLRTWRQRVRDLKQEAAKAVVPPPANAPDAEPALPEFALLYRQGQLERLRDDPTFATEVNEAYGRIEPLFRRIEALRMNLAKHEVPKMKGVPALAPGYGRIDMTSGSMVWQVDLGDMEVDMVSRRSLADELREIVIGGPIARERAAEKSKKLVRKEAKKAAARQRKKENKLADKKSRHEKTATATLTFLPCSRVVRNQGRAAQPSLLNLRVAYARGTSVGPLFGAESQKCVPSFVVEIESTVC